MKVHFDVLIIKVFWTDAIEKKLMQMQYSGMFVVLLN